MAAEMTTGGWWLLATARFDAVVSERHDSRKAQPSH